MSKMLVKLGDVCIKDSSNIAQKDLINLEGLYPIYGASGFIKNINQFNQDKPYVAIVKDGAGVGRAMYLPAYSSVIGTLQYILPKDNIDSKYLFYAISFMDLTKYAKGATIPHIYFKEYKEELLNLPDLESQQKIVAKLDNLNFAIDKCKRLLELHDELIKSKFYEMFGDIISNSKSWNIYLLKDISDSRLGKMLDSKQNLKESSKPYLANFNVQWFKFDLNKLNEMDFDDNEQKEFRLKHGDLLVTEGGEVGRCAIWNNEMNECYFQKALHRVRCNLSLVLPIYLAWWFKFRSDFNKFEDIVGGVTTIAHLTGIKLKSLQIPLPPLQLQTQFAQYVETVESSKTKIKELQSRIEYLKASYMQEYFA